MIEAVIFGDHDQADAEAGSTDDTRVGITPLGALAYSLNHPSRPVGGVELGLFGRTQTAMLDVVKAALMVADTWRVCYVGCSCARCCLYHATRRLIATVNVPR